MGFWADHLRRHCEKPDIIVNGEGRPYLKRYTLIHQPWFRVYVHEILLSDDDRALHDHPWDFTTVLLSSGYSEEFPTRPEIWGEKNKRWDIYNPIERLVLNTMRVFWPRLSIIRHKAEDFHRIDLPEGKSVWTLFIAGEKRREWGFMTPNGWVDWRTYLDKKFGPNSIEADMAGKEMGE